MTSYYQRDVLESTGTLNKGQKIRCDGEITVRGVRQRCGQILVQVADPQRKAGRYEVACRRCGKHHAI